MAHVRLIEPDIGLSAVAAKMFFLCFDVFYLRFCVTYGFMCSFIYELSHLVFSF